MLSCWLTFHGAKSAGVDASGKLIWAFMSDRSWKVTLKLRVELEEGLESVIAKARSETRWDEDDTEQARTAIAVPEPAEAVRSGPSSDVAAASIFTPSRKSKKRKKSKKRMKTVKPQAEGASVAAATSLMAQLYVNGNAESSGSKDTALAAAPEKVT
jgi:hypothetical protein